MKGGNYWSSHATLKELLNFEQQNKQGKESKVKLKQSTLPHKSPKKRKQGDEFIVKTHGGTLSVPIMPKGPKLNDCESDDIESFDDDIESNMAENKGSFYMHETIYNFGNKAGVDEETQRMDEDFQIPTSINDRLKGFQKTGVKFLYNLWKAQQGGILGDEMGLGKSIQTIAFISSIKGGRKPIGKESFFLPTTQKEKLLDQDRTVSLSNKPIIIVVPAGIVAQWKNEFRNWASLKVVSFSTKEKSQIFTRAKTHKLDVVIIGYESFRKHFKEINEIDWECYIFDEVHKIKSQNSILTKHCKHIKTKFRIGLTGTLIQNSFDELWTVVDIICPGFFGSEKDFRRLYDIPIKTGQRHDATHDQINQGRVAALELQKKLNHILLRRTKECIKDELPGKADNIVFCKLTSIQLECYKRILESPTYSMLRKKGKYSANRKNIFFNQKDDKEWGKLVLPAIVRLQKLCNHVSLLEPSRNADPNSSKYKDELAYEGIAFGEDKARILSKIEKRDDTELSGKMLVLKTLLKEWKGTENKILLFSNSTRMMDILGHFLKTEGYCFSRIDGSTPAKTRTQLVDIFNRSKSQYIFLLSTKACGLGLNLSSANIVVIFDPNWNASWDLQAQDRAHRLGQEKFCKVYRLIAAGTIEEMKYVRQVYKQQLANIGLKGQQERRYFNGVAGVKGQEGEIFGLTNLFRLDPGSVITNEIINRTIQQEENNPNYYIKTSDEVQEENAQAETQANNNYNGHNRGMNLNNSNSLPLMNNNGLARVNLENGATSSERGSAAKLNANAAESGASEGLFDGHTGILSTHLNTDIVGQSNDRSGEKKEKGLLLFNGGSNITTSASNSLFATPANTNHNKQHHHRPANIFANSLLTAGANFRDMSQEDDEVLIINNNYRPQHDSKSRTSNESATRNNSSNNSGANNSNRRLSLNLILSSPSPPEIPVREEEKSAVGRHLDFSVFESRNNSESYEHQDRYEMLEDDETSPEDMNNHFIDDDYEDDLDDFDDDVIFFSQIEDMNFLKDESEEDSGEVGDEIDMERFSSQSGSTDSGPASQQRVEQAENQQRLQLQRQFARDITEVARPQDVTIISDDSDEESENLLEL